MVKMIKSSDKVSKMEAGSSNGLLLPALGFLAVLSGCVSLVSLALGWPALVSLLCVTSTISFGAAVVFLGMTKANSYMKSSDESVDKASMLETPGEEVRKEYAAAILEEKKSRSTGLRR